MFTLTSLLLRVLRPAAAAEGNPSRQLLERAGARAGHDPRQARELRAAASAWLRVVR